MASKKGAGKPTIKQTVKVSAYIVYILYGSVQGAVMSHHISIICH